MNIRSIFSRATLSAITICATLITQIQPAEAHHDLYLPAGTPIDVQLALSLPSLSEMHNGAPLSFIVKHDVIVDGWVAVPHGALVRAIVSTTAAANTNTEATPLPASSSGPSGLLGTATNALNNATFSFEWVQLPGGKVHLDNQPQSVVTALMGIGYGAFSAASSVLGALKNQSGVSAGIPDLSIHSLLEAHIAEDVHVPALGREPQAPAPDDGFITH
jgi:hypothetical protein